MNVLITGVAGFIGSHLADALIADGHEVWGIDNFLTGQKANVPGDVGFRVGGIDNDYGILGGLFCDAAPDVVVHAAASYDDPGDIEGDVLTNAYGTARVVTECKEHSTRLIYLQTSLCYGITPTTHPISPNRPLDPRGSYATSKTAGEWIIRDSGLDYVSFRLANIYGPRNLSGPVPTFYKRLKAGKPCVVADTRRDFVYIDDAVSVFRRAVCGEGSGVYHVATGGDFPIRLVYQHVLEAMGLPEHPDAEPVPRRPDDAASILLDQTRTVEDFPGWGATTPLEEGIGRAVAWYDEHGVGDTYTHLHVDG